MLIWRSLNFRPISLQLMHIYTCLMLVVEIIIEFEFSHFEKYIILFFKVLHIKVGDYLTTLNAIPILTLNYTYKQLFIYLEIVEIKGKYSCCNSF